MRGRIRNPHGPDRYTEFMTLSVLLENYYLPGNLERQIGAFVDYCNNQRYHESLDNVTPADVYFGRGKAIIREREKIKKFTIRQRRLQHQKQAGRERGGEFWPRSILRSTSTPPSDDSAPPSKRAWISRVSTGDRPGRNRLSLFMAGGFLAAGE
ncbi:Mobile element protein [hydrothermal vent metagenome]|uniref:Mobile element protein n=1 Tax=hydrothermal vent metagenome TaxID=652676 RepID=A0A3B0TX47_9ZZZZ